MFCIKDAEELIATKIETNEEIYGKNIINGSG